jgi:hypothetical protein
VPASYAADLNAGLASVGLRRAFADADTPLPGVWLIQDEASRYQLTEDTGIVVVTSGGANLSPNWTITSSGGKYELSRNGSDIVVSQDGTTLSPCRPAWRLVSTRESPQVTWQTPSASMASP